MFGGWKVNGKIQQEPPPEFWDKLDKALIKVFGVTIYGEKEEEKDEDKVGKAD
jgi:hypothetical protein